MAAKDAKEIRHCGCYYDSIEGTFMKFHDVLVAANSNGHKNHVVSDEDFDDQVRRRLRKIFDSSSYVMDVTVL